MSKPNYLYGFDRHLPVPFEETSKKINGVASKYAPPTSAKASTLSAPMLKALLAFHRMKSDPGNGGVGVTASGLTVVEYVSSIENQIHLVTYDPTSGKVQALVYDKDLGTGQAYKGGKDARDCAAIFLALIPVFEQDAEFSEQLEIFDQECSTVVGVSDDMIHSAAILCDNFYRRLQKEAVILDDNCVSPPKIGLANIDAGQYTPDIIAAGEFQVFASTAASFTGTKAPSIPHTDFVGKFRFHKRELTKDEQNMVPELSDWYVVPEDARQVCLHAMKTTEKKKPMRNFLLRGPAGTGKTEMAKAIAAGLDLPYVKYTCSANTEVYDFIGQMMPVNADTETEIPSYDDIGFDPAGSYLQLTGLEKSDATPDDCLAVVKKLISGSETKYEYTETDFLKALKYGYVCEIQEPTVIMQPGVLVGLNSLLEQDGMITLPTGEVIRRHPDCVIIVTTNVSYEGCRSLNQSVVDRMSLVKDILLPDKSIMLERAVKVTEFEDPAMAERMVDVVLSMIDYCKHQGIDDGEIGIRSLIDWMLSTEVTDDPYRSALDTVVAKATSEEADRASLVENCLAPIFTPKRKTR